MRPISLTFAAVSFAAGSIVSACNLDPNHQDEDAARLDTSTANEPPHANMVVQPASVNLNQSGSTAFSVGVTRINYSGPATYSFEGLPAGVSGGSTSNAPALSLVLNASASAAPGTYAVVIRQKGTGIPDNTAAVTVRIGTNTGRTFGVSLGSSSVSIKAGSNLSIPVTVTRSSGITESILVSAENVPDFMSAYIGYVAAGTSTGTMALGTTTRLPAGTYQLYLRGSVTGETDMVFPFSVIVTK